jgi:hypothetical protein
MVGCSSATEAKEAVDLGFAEKIVTDIREIEE